PTVLEGLVDLVRGVGGGSRGQPERVGAPHAGEVDGQVSHGALLHRCRAGLARPLPPARRPWGRRGPPRRRSLAWSALACRWARPAGLPAAARLVAWRSPPRRSCRPALP